MQEIRSSNSPVVTGICDANKSRARHYHSFHPGPILESNGMRAIFQKKGKKYVKKGKKGQNIWKFEQKGTNFEKGQVIACDYRTQ